MILFKRFCLTLILFLALLISESIAVAQTNPFISSQQKNQNKSVAPLVPVTWGQSCRYNEHCPVDSAGSCYHSRTGCGATAMAMLMKYWEFPEHGIGSHSYDNPPYGVLSADFENTTYDWDNMPVKLLSSSTTQEIDAVAELMYHAGIAADMWYTTNASFSDLWDIRNAMINCFNYSSTSEYLDRSNFSDSVWTAMMKAEIDEGRPVIYGFSGGSGGHFTVMDGYLNDSVFHFNWGDASANGYYKTFDELPIIQQAIIGIEPNYPALIDTSIFVSTRGIFNDGSNAEDYANNTHRYWLIQPPGATNISLMFSEIETEYETDFVRIYDGDNLFAPLLGSYSGSALPAVIQTTSGSALVEFVSDASNTRSGWEIHYTCTQPGSDINGLTVLTDPSGVFEDGSGGSNYPDNTNRYWLIKPDTASHITLHFNNFYTEADWDFLYVYEGENPAPENLIGTFTGNSVPADVVCRKGAMLLHFQTDWNTNKAGWEVSYQAGFEKIELHVKVYLQGAWNNGQMTTFLQDEIPLNQPFDVLPEASWYYEGPEALSASIPTGTVDWLLLELRDAPQAAMASSQTIVDRQAGFVLTDGSVVNIEGENPTFRYSPSDSLYLVLRHRNHLAVMTSCGLIGFNGLYPWDFTQTANKSFGGLAALTEIETGVWGMTAGDVDGNDTVNSSDIANVWSFEAGVSAYLSSDLNQDLEVNNIDKNEFLLPGMGKGCQVPE